MEKGKGRNFTSEKRRKRTPVVVTLIYRGIFKDSRLGKRSARSKRCAQTISSEKRRRARVCAHARAAPDSNRASVP